MEKQLKLLVPVVTIFTICELQGFGTLIMKNYTLVFKGCSLILSEEDLAQVDLSLSLLFVCDPICFLRPELQWCVHGIMQIRELI